MARKRAVTRTIVTTKARLKCYNIAEDCVEEKEVTLSGDLTFSDIEKEEMDGFKILNVISTEKHETLYGMDEQKFIEAAEVLPPRKQPE